MKHLEGSKQLKGMCVSVCHQCWGQMKDNFPLPLRAWCLVATSTVGLGSPVLGWVQKPVLPFGSVKGLLLLLGGLRDEGAACPQ